MNKKEYDSSYDSDPDQKPHQPISQKTSETLAQEFSEHITLSPIFQSRIDFAQKLGYTQSQLTQALEKLGSDPGQDELLSELIKLDGYKKEDEEIEEKVEKERVELRHVIVDGCNVAREPGHFSPVHLLNCSNFFTNRQHKVTIFLPNYHRNTHPILNQLEQEGSLVYTPSRAIENKRLTCYDDRYVLKLAVDVDGVIVSNDGYRDLLLEMPEYKKFLKERLLMFSFVGERFMPPEDPLGRTGPSLNQFLTKSTEKSKKNCPYGKKCTYGMKCKYFHTEKREPISETLRKQSAKTLAAKTQSVPITNITRNAVTRTRSAIVSHTVEQPEVKGHRKLAREPSVGYLDHFPGEPGLSRVWGPVDEVVEVDKRVKLLNQLSQIFPLQQVKDAMMKFPEIEEGSLLCAEIIQMNSCNGK